MARPGMQARSLVGVLQMPRTKGERLRHMEILDRVPFDLVPAYEQRNKVHGRQQHQALPGSIGKVLRRHRQDAATVLLNTMLQACVERREDELLWDTVAAELREEAPKMGPADVGLALACLVKASYRRDPGLYVLLLRRLGAAAEAVKAPRRGGAGSGAAAVATEHALAAGIAAVQHMGLAQACADDLARLCARVQRGRSSISRKVLCRIVHHAGALASARSPEQEVDRPKVHRGDGVAGRLLSALRGELCRRLSAASPGGAAAAGQKGRAEEEEDAEEDKDWPGSDLCLVAHAYAQAALGDADRPLFEAMRGRLSDVALLELNPGQLANLANAFAKLSQASELGHVELFGRIGRHLAQSAESMGLRSACVSLSAFAQAAVRHEPLFFTLEPLLPAWLHSADCDARQLAMLAHAHVRVGLTKSSLLPLLWEHGRRLAPSSDAHGISVLIFALTKASALGAGTGGEALLQVLCERLLELLEPVDARVGRGAVHPATVAVTAYALARGGCAELVDPQLWRRLAACGSGCVEALTLTEAANVATALATATRTAPQVATLAAVEVQGFCRALRCRLDRLLPSATAALPRPQRGLVPADPLPPLAAAKLVAAFGDLRCLEAAPTVVRLAYRCLALGSGRQSLGVGPLRSIAAALVRLRVHDEDLLQALTVAQRPRRSSACPRH